jgi:hypothetical protein
MVRIRPEEITHEENAKLEARAKRLARTDMHTLLEGEMQKVSALSNDELKKLANNSNFSELTRLAAEKTLRKRLDPEDQDAVSV